MIPKIIHCCWFGGKALPDSVKKYMNSWKKYNPDFEIRVWTERNFDYNENRYTKEAYINKKWAFVTDYVRLKVLYDNGGIYMDTDVEVLQSLEPLLNHKAFSGFEGPDRIPTGIMGAERENKWIELLLKDYDDRPFVKEDGTFDLTTNVTLITETTKRNYPIRLNNTYQDLGDVVFYPFDVLCAKDLKDGKVKSNLNTITVHHFNGSWMTLRKRLIKYILKTFGSDFVKRLVRVKNVIKGKRV